MPTGQFKTSHVPAEKVEAVVAGYRADGATKIQKIVEPGGTWTVIATYDAPDDSSQSKLN